MTSSLKFKISAWRQLRTTTTGARVESQIRAELTDFIVSNYLFGDASRTPADDDSLVEGGVIDSTGILELIEFLEAQFDIEVAESETVPENLDSITRMTGFVLGKRTVLETA